MGFVLGESGTCNRGKPVGNGCGYNPHPPPAGIPMDIPAVILGLPAIMSCSKTYRGLRTLGTGELVIPPFCALVLLVVSVIVCEDSDSLMELPLLGTKVYGDGLIDVDFFSALVSDGDPGADVVRPF